MNILFITPSDPRQTDYGSAQRTHLLWSALKKAGAVYTLVLSRENGPAAPDGRIRFAQPVRRKGWPGLVNAAWRSVFRLFGAQAVDMLPYSRCPDLSGIFTDCPHFDLVVARYMKTAMICRAWEIAPLAIDMDDHPLQLFDTITAVHMGWGRRRLARAFLAARLRQAERRTAAEWVANPDQATEKKACCPRLVLPNRPTIASPSSSEGNPVRDLTYLVTVGRMSYWPNWAGVSRFLEEVWPSVRARHPGLEYRICGQGAPDSAVAKWRTVPGVSYLGFVEDLAAIYRDAAAIVVPVDAGGGTCIKTLEALACARVCLATPFGARGVGHPPDGLLVYETAADFASLLERNVFDVARRQHLEQDNLRYMIENFSQEAFDAAVARGVALACPGREDCRT